MHIIIRGSFSEWVKITSGVPQGSALGPVLFIIFVNYDMPDVVNSTLLMFADDTKLYRTITSPHDSIIYCRMTLTILVYGVSNP